jgi:hypothetical protein
MLEARNVERQRRGRPATTSVPHAGVQVENAQPGPQTDDGLEGPEGELGGAQQLYDADMAADVPDAGGQAAFHFRCLDNSLTMVYRTLNTSTHQVAIGLCLPVIPGLAVHSPLTSTFLPIAPTIYMRLPRLALLYTCDCLGSLYYTSAPVVVIQRLLHATNCQHSDSLTFTNSHIIYIPNLVKNTY